VRGPLCRWSVISYCSLGRDLISRPGFETALMAHTNSPSLQRTPLHGCDKYLFAAIDDLITDDEVQAAAVLAPYVLPKTRMAGARREIITPILTILIITIILVLSSVRA